MSDDVFGMLALAHRVRRGDRASLLEAKTLANHVITLAGRLEEAERARDLLIEMSISDYPGPSGEAEYRLETFAGVEYFPTREQAVARLLDVAGVTDDDTTEDAR